MSGGLLTLRSGNTCFFSHCHKSQSRIVFFLIASPLVNSVVSCSTRTIAITDHTAVELCLNTELDMGKRTSWRMNTSLLQEENLNLFLK